MKTNGTSDKVEASKGTIQSALLPLTKERFAPALRLIGTGRLECVCEPKEDDYAEEISLMLLASSGMMLLHAELPTADCDPRFGINDERDYQLDLEYRSLGDLLASSPALLDAAERLPKVEAERDELLRDMDSSDAEFNAVVNNRTQEAFDYFQALTNLRSAVESGDADVVARAMTESSRDALLAKAFAWGMDESAFFDYKGAKKRIADVEADRDNWERRCWQIDEEHREQIDALTAERDRLQDVAVTAVDRLPYFAAQTIGRDARYEAVLAAAYRAVQVRKGAINRGERLDIDSDSMNYEVG